MKKLLSNIVISLFFLVSLTVIPVGKTLAHFEDGVKISVISRAADFDLEVILPSSLTDKGSIPFYSLSVTQYYHFQVRNNSEVSVRCALLTDSSEFNFDFSPQEFQLKPGEVKEIEAAMQPKAVNPGLYRATVVVSADQID